MKTCSRCNTSVSDEYSFCLNCGNALEPSVARADEPLPTLVYQGPETAPSNVSPTLPTPTRASQRSKNSRLPWLLVLGCILTIVVLVVIIASQRRSSVTQTVAATEATPTQSAPTEASLTGTTPTPTDSEIAFNSNLNRPTPLISPQEKKQATTTPTPSAGVDNPQPAPSVSPTPSVESTPSPSPTVDPARIYSNREVSERVRLLSKPQPAYTEEGRKNQVTGVVVLRVVFTSGGRVGSVSVVSGLPYGLTEQAIAAAKRIQFVPAQKDGVPVSVSMQVEYVFNLY